MQKRNWKPWLLERSINISSIWSSQQMMNGLWKSTDPWRLHKSKENQHIEGPMPCYLLIFVCNKNAAKKCKQGREQTLCTGEITVSQNWALGYWTLISLCNKICAQFLLKWSCGRLAKLPEWGYLARFVNETSANPLLIVTKKDQFCPIKAVLPSFS